MASRNPHLSLWLCFGIGFALSAASLLASPEASLLLFCITLFCGFWMMEGKRRSGWELSHSFKIRKIEKDAQNFARILTNHDSEIEDLKIKVEKLSLRKDSAAEPITLVKPILAKPELRAAKPAHTRSYNDLFNLETVQTRRNPPLTSVPSNDGYSDAVVEEMLDHAIRTNSIEVFAQPVMRLPARQIKYFEMFARLRARPGVYIPARRLKDHGKALDTIMLLRCLDLIKSAPPRTNLPPFFLKIEGPTLKNPEFIRALLPFAAKNRDLAGQVMFELPYADFHTLDGAGLKIMEGLARLGCTFALGRLETAPDPKSVDLEKLMHYRIKALKIDSTLFLKALEVPKLSRLKSRVEGNGIALVFDRIDTEARLRDVLEFGPNYGQGSLFGRPDLKGAYMPAVKTKRA